MKHTWKKTAAFVLAMALVVGAAPANVGTGGFLGGTAITANAEGTMVGQYVRTPGRGAEITFTFSGASSSNPIYIKNVKGSVQTITSENVAYSHSAAGSYDYLNFNGTEIYKGGWDVPIGIAVKSGSGTETDPYILVWNYNRVNGDKFSDFTIGDKFNGMEIELTADSITLPATTEKWITVTTEETSQNYSLENGVTLTGLDASSTFEIYTPDISTATINLEDNTANITSVRHGGKNLTETTEYTVASYTDENNEPIEKPNPTDYGSYHVTVTGAGKYSGSVTKDFSIVRIQRYNVTLSDNNGHSKAYNNTELPLTIESDDFQYDWGYMDYHFMIRDNIVINADTESFDVQYMDRSTGNFDEGQMTIYVNVEKLQSTVTTAPTALENLTANGSEMELLDTSNAAADILIILIGELTTLDIAVGDHILVDSLRKIVINDLSVALIIADLSALEQIGGNSFWSVCNCFCNLALQAFCNAVIAFTCYNSQHVNVMNFIAKNARVHSVAVLIDTETQTSADFLALANFTCGLFQGTNLEYVRIVPTLTKSRVREYKTNRRTLRITVKEKFLVFHDKVIRRYIVRSLLFLVDLTVCQLALFVYGEVSCMGAVSRNCIKIADIVIALAKFKLIILNYSLVFFLKHIRIDTVHRLSRFIILLVFCNFINEEKRQHLDSLMEKLSLTLDM